MRFENTYMFNLIWILMVVVLFLIFANRRRNKILNNFISCDLMKDIVPGYSNKIYGKSIVLISGVLLFSIFALARPQWGFQWQEIKREGLDIMVAVDVSKSMLAEDVKPNRLERTKLAIYDLLKKLKTDRIGLVVFSGDAFLFCPLTVDYSGFVLSLEDLNVNTVPRGGTDLSTAIREAMKAYKGVSTKYKALVIITDGDNLEGDPIEMAKKAKESGIKIFTIGIGTKEGDLIQLTNNKGEKEFLKDNQGNFVKSKLNENLLQQIASITDGAYVRSSGAQFGLDVIYDNYLKNMETRETESKMNKRYYERFQIPLAIALIFLIGETCLIKNS